MLIAVALKSLYIQCALYPAPVLLIHSYDEVNSMILMKIPYGQVEFNAHTSRLPRNKREVKAIKEMQFRHP